MSNPDSFSETWTFLSVKDVGDIDKTSSRHHSFVRIYCTFFNSCDWWINDVKWLELPLPGSYNLSLINDKKVPVHFALNSQQKILGIWQKSEKNIFA